MWIMTSITLSKYYMASWLYVQIGWFTIKALLLLKFKTIVITHPYFLESIVVTFFLVMYIFNKQSEAVSRARRKGATKVFKHGRKSPWVPTLTGPFPKGKANAASWLGTKNGLYHCAQSANSFSWVLFVSSYKTAVISRQLPRVRSPSFPKQKRRNYRKSRKTFGMLSAAGAIQFELRKFCFWRITMYRK